jgi:hypothetical protein
MPCSCAFDVIPFFPSYLSMHDQTLKDSFELGSRSLMRMIRAVFQMHSRILPKISSNFQCEISTLTIIAHVELAVYLYCSPRTQGEAKQFVRLSSHEY